MPTLDRRTVMNGKSPNLSFASGGRSDNRSYGDHGPARHTDRKLETRSTWFVRMASYAFAFLLTTVVVLGNGQNTSDNWPAERDPNWTALKNHLDWCHNALVERYTAAGLDPVHVHVPTYIYPFYDYREFLADVEEVAPHFVDHTKVGANGTFEEWFSLYQGYIWHDTGGYWYPSTPNTSFPFWTFEDLLDSLPSIQLGVQYPDTVVLPARSVVVPGWEVGEMTTREVTLNLPEETVEINTDRWHLDELPLRVWQDASLGDNIPEQVSAAINQLKWTGINGSYANRMTVYAPKKTTYRTCSNDPGAEGGDYENLGSPPVPQSKKITLGFADTTSREIINPTSIEEYGVAGSRIIVAWNCKQYTIGSSATVCWDSRISYDTTVEFDDWCSVVEGYNSDFQIVADLPTEAIGVTVEAYSRFTATPQSTGLGGKMYTHPWGGSAYYSTYDPVGRIYYNPGHAAEGWWPSHYDIGVDRIGEYVMSGVTISFRNSIREWVPNDAYGIKFGINGGFELPSMGLPTVYTSGKYEVIGSMSGQGAQLVMSPSVTVPFPGTLQERVNGHDEASLTFTSEYFSEVPPPPEGPVPPLLYDPVYDVDVDISTDYVMSSAPSIKISSGYNAPLVLLKWNFVSGNPPPAPVQFSGDLAVPDTDRDDLVDIGVDIASLGPDSGLLTYLPEQADPYLVMPQIQPPAWFAGLDVKGYFTFQNRVLPYWHNVKTDAGWRNPNAQTRRVTDNDGYQTSYSLNTRILDAGACVNGGIKKAAVIRPRGQVVVFKFDETDPETHTFSPYGYPEAPHNNQSYVLVDTTPDNHYDYSFELRFDSGIVHVFGADGTLVQVKDHRGYSIGIGHGYIDDIGGSSTWTANDWSSEANVGPVGATDKRYTVANTWTAGRLTKVLYTVGSEVIEVTLDYDAEAAGRGMIKSVAKSQLSESDAARDGNTITFGTGVKLSRVGTGPVTLTRTVPSESPLSVAYTLDSGNRLVKEAVSVNGGTATTTYQRNTGVSRYPETGALGAAKLVKIIYPDNAEVSYTYDPPTGWLATETRPVGNGVSRQWTFSYNPDDIGAPGDDPYGGATTNLVERPRVVDLTFGSTPIGRTLHDYSGPNVTTKRCQNVGALWADSLNLSYSSTCAGSGHAAGLPLTETTPTGNSVWTHGALGNLNTYASHPAEGRDTQDSINAFGHTTASKVISTLDGANVTTHHVIRETGAFGRITEETDQLSGDTREFLAYCLHGPQTVVEIDGSSSLYEYTPLGYVKKLSEPAFARTTTWNYDPLGNVKSKVLTAEGKTWTEEATYDAQSRLTHQSNPQTYSDYAYSSTSEGTTVVTTRPKLGDIREDYYFDGSLKKRYGDGAVVRTLHKYEIDEGMYRVQRIALNTSDGETLEKSKTFYNLLGAVAKTSDGNDKIYTPQYDSYGRQDNATDPEGYLYPVQYHSTRNEIEKTGVGDVAESGNNPVNKSGRSVSAATGQEWKTKGFPDAGSGADVVMSGTRVSLDRRTTTTTRMGLQDTTVQTPGYTAPGKYAGDTTFHNGRTTETSYEKWRIKEETRKDSTGVEEETVEYTHNGLGALVLRKNKRGTSYFNFSYDYDSVQRLKSITPPDGLTGYTTINYFENTTLRNTVMKSDGTTYGCDYTPAGLLKEEFLISGTGSGAGIGGNIHYLYDYDGQGRLTHLRYFNGGSFVTTEWKYYEKTGLLKEKVFQGGNKEQYEYRDNGQLSKITLPDGVTQNFVYDTENALLKQVNTIGGGVNLTTTFDRLGRPQASAVVGGAGQSLSRESDGQPATETISGSVIAGGTVTRTYFAGHRGVNTVTHAISSGDTSSAIYTYNSGPRVETVTRDDLEVTYDYNLASLTPDFIEWRKGSTPVLSCLIDWDTPNTRIAKMTYSLDGTTLASYDYAFISGGHRISRITLKDTSYWQYAYDGRGYLLSANLYDSTGTPVLGRQFFFSTDTMGNLLQSGPMDPSGVPMYSFTANSLNLHVTRAWGNQVELGGSADSAAVVTVNGVTATRQNSLFRAVLTVDNSGGAVDLPVAVNALNPVNQFLAQATGTIRVPKDAEVPAYGVNGQITGSSKYSCQWNGLGWLTQVDSVGATPAFKIEFDYYPDGRRARKRYYEETTPSTWVLKREHHFYYDQWLLIAEKVIDNGTTYWNRYTWGLDIAGRLSGRMGQEAGGIGGLLAVQRVEGSTVTTYLPICDHNGNVMAVVDADTKEVVAEYTYSPYGTLIASDGPAKDKFPLRFQSKYYDHETGFYYYTYRYYDPMTAKWLSRDPLGERGGVNLTAFCGGDPVNQWDALGLFTRSDVERTFGHALEAYIAAMDKLMEEDASEETVKRIASYYQVEFESLTKQLVAIDAAADELGIDPKDWDSNTKTHADAYDLIRAEQPTSAETLATFYWTLVSPVPAAGSVPGPGVRATMKAIWAAAKTGALRMRSNIGQLGKLAVLPTENPKAGFALIQGGSHLPPSQLYRTAIASFNKEGLTNAGRALSKHPGIVGLTKETFNKVLRTASAQNKAAHTFLKNLIRNNRARVIKNVRWGEVIEIRGANGLGARWQLDGTFIGFVD